MESAKGADGFHFLQTLAVHKGSVRSVTVLPDTDSLVSGSMDKSAKLFGLDKQSGKYTLEREFDYHDSFIFCVYPDISNNGFYTAC